MILSLLSLKGSSFLFITPREMITLIACASIVAMAAPDTPNLKTATKNRSPQILHTHAIATVSSGILESPIPLKMLPITLYATIKILPALQILI